MQADIIVISHFLEAINIITHTAAAHTVKALNVKSDAEDMFSAIVGIM